jgi:hypothetical protein
MGDSRQLLVSTEAKCTINFFKTETGEELLEEDLFSSTVQSRFKNGCEDGGQQWIVDGGIIVTIPCAVH